MKILNHKIIIAFAMAVTLIFTLSLSHADVSATSLYEDCDLDGYDDYTGDPVPWVGFDGTRGDEIPADWDGVSDSYYKNSGGTTETTASPVKETTASSVKETTASSVKETTASSSGSSNSGSSNSGSSSTGNSSSSSTKNNSGTSSSSGSSGSTSNGSSTTSSGSSDAGSGSSDSVAGSGSSDVISSDSGSDTETSTQVSDENETDADTENTKDKDDVKDSDQDTEETQEDEGTISENGTYSLSFTEADGNIIHAGSTILVSGLGFTGYEEDLEIEIHSQVKLLGTVVPSTDGAFELEVEIPKNLEAGTHEIVVLYQGKEIAKKTILVEPKVADTFLAALTVGFSGENSGLIPGLLLLAGLGILGGAALVISKTTGGFSKFRKSKEA